jgi:pseudouridine kinase
MTASSAIRGHENSHAIPSGAPRILLIGGCHRDIVASTAEPFQPGTSCPGQVVERPGGVARNVAVLIASAGLGATLVSRVGDDAAGRSLAEALRAAGVEPRLHIDAKAATGTYTAIHDRAGELVAAVSDMSIYDAITPADAEVADPHDRVFADANLPAATLQSLAERWGERLAVDAISRAKAGRVLSAIRAGALGFMNLPSAEALIGAPLATPAEAADRLLALGASRVVVTGGPAPVAVLDRTRITIHAVEAVPVVDVTGAGDALIAGTLAALARGFSLPSAVEVGINASRAALASVGALDRLPPSVLAALAKGTPS